jgi:DNA-binding CsgD family transcriptional regulator
LGINAEGGIAFANRAAKDLLRSRPSDRKQRRGETLDQLLGPAISRFKRNPEHYVELSTGDDKSLIVLIAPFGGDGAAPSEPTSIMFVSNPMAAPELDLRSIAQLYGLTRAETRLLQAVCRGDRIGEYAVRSGITLNTAKGHLKQLFSKTQTSRQSDLVRLVFANPVFWLVSMKSADRNPPSNEWRQTPGSMFL